MSSGSKKQYSNQQKKQEEIIINTRKIRQKLASTKLWCAIAGAAVGVYIALGGNMTDIQSIAGAVTALLSLATYIVTEGRVDAEAVKLAADALQKLGGSTENQA